MVNAIINVLLFALLGWAIGAATGEFAKKKINEAIEPLEEATAELELQVHFLTWLLSGKAEADRKTEEELLREVEENEVTK